jgi:hypothetical protein
MCILRLKLPGLALICIGRMVLLCRQAVLPFLSEKLKLIEEALVSIESEMVGLEEQEDDDGGLGAEPMRHSLSSHADYQLTK